MHASATASASTAAPVSHLAPRRVAVAARPAARPAARGPAAAAFPAVRRAPAATRAARRVAAFAASATTAGAPVAVSPADEAEARALLVDLCERTRCNPM
jgi:hypothetical protein